MSNLSIEWLIHHCMTQPHQGECLGFIDSYVNLFNTSKGSATKHQAWPGGYRDHITEVMNIAMVTYQALQQIRPLPFTMSDAMVGCFIHDVEKLWKHALDPKDDLRIADLRLEDDLRRIDKDRLLSKHFTMTDDLWNSVKYAHGEGDDYHPTDRIQSPLAAFVHHCDNTSARIWFDKPGEHERG